jgi:cleavage and polyadenylation specificity factor subunit 3
MRLCMLLEAQFGSNIAPIERPRLPSLSTLPSSKGDTSTPAPAVKSDPDRDETPASTSKDNEKEMPNGKEEEGDGAMDKEESEPDIEAMEAAELERLHSLGIPVPGIEIKVDKHVARVWLETLEVECTYPVLRDRVKIVVERAVETVAGLWAKPPSFGTGKNGHVGVFGDEMDVGL